MSNKLSLPENLGISEHLRDFLIHWLVWATADKVVRGAPYYPHMGLCAALPRWFDVVWVSKDMQMRVRNELTNLFGVTCKFYDGRINFPFGHTNYNVRRLDETQHKDPKRLEWVRAALELPIKEEY